MLKFSSTYLLSFTWNILPVHAENSIKFQWNRHSISCRCCSLWSISSGLIATHEEYVKIARNVIIRHCIHCDYSHTLNATLLHRWVPSVQTNLINTCEVTILLVSVNCNEFLKLLSKSDYFVKYYVDSVLINWAVLTQGSILIEVKQFSNVK